MNDLLKQSMRLQSVPTQPLEHSKVSIPFNHTTSFNFGDLVPFYFSDVIPGSTFEINTNMVARLSTPLFPTMGNANIDYYYFFVPYRLVWDHWQNFCGENTEGAWAPNVKYTIPSAFITPQTGDLFDHFGVPTGVNQELGVLPFRAYRLIWNEWFRNENVQDPLLVNRGDTESLSDYRNMLKVCRYPDLFSTCLPSPQKGQPVEISLLGQAPVVFGPEHDVMSLSATDSMRFHIPNSNGSNGSLYLEYESGDIYRASGVASSNPLPSADGVFINNAWADMTSLSVATVNQLREAFATQRILEAFARCGTRYTEMLRGIFNVVNPDGRLQRPEYLGGDRVRIEMQQVLQTSSTNVVSPQGNTAAFSKTVTGRKNFTHTFTEHGVVIGVMCARVLHTYQQGRERYWDKRDFSDFYMPQLAHIGEQPVYTSELYASDNNSRDIFGYQEAWYEYRNKPSIISGQLRSSAPQSLDAWHYADFYESAPILSDSWIKEGSSEVARTLAVSEELSDQLIVDIYQKNYATLPMPLFSVPGLIDHF